MRPGRRAGSDHDVQLVVLERGVELLFHHRLQAMDFIQEKHLPRLQIGEDGGHVALHLQRRPAGLLKAHVQLIGDDRR